jgi:hypothetical protein
MDVDEMECDTVKRIHVTEDRLQQRGALNTDMKLRVP